MIKQISISVFLLVFCVTTAQQKEIDQKREKLQKVYKSLDVTGKKQHAIDKSAGIPPNEYFEQDFKNTLDPETGLTAFSSLSKLKSELDQGKYQPKQELSFLSSKSLAKDGKTIINQPWVERGPFEVGGRTRAIMFDPNDASGKRVFAGAVTGGLWVNQDITNAASEWTPLSQFWTNTTVHSIAFDPNNPQIFYVGTGESETGDGSGSGIWKSTNGGTTWTNIFTAPTTYTGTTRRGIFYVNDVKVRNNGGVSEIYAGVSGGYVGGSFVDSFGGLYEAGLYKSTDGGANFTRNTSFYAYNTGNTQIGHDIQQIEIASDNSIWVATRNSRFGATSPSGGKIFRSTDGVTFNNIYNANLQGSRVNIGLSKTNALKAYGILQGNGAAEPVRIIKTVDGGATWIATNDATPVITLPADADSGIPANDFTRGQSFYDLGIYPDPTNDDIVYTGGIDIFKSTNGAVSWSQISKWSNNNNLAALQLSTVHADQHTTVFNPKNPNQMLFGNDGGIFYVADKANIATLGGFQVRNKRYNATQFYRATLNPTATPANEEFIAGAQDNGTQILEGAPLANSFYASDTFTGGDGAFTEYDDNNKYILPSYVNNTHYLYSVPLNGLYNLINSSAARNTGHFINEMTVDRNKDIFFSYTTGLSLFKVTGLASNPVSLTRTTISAGTPASGEQVSALKVSPFTTASTTLYVGSNLGKLYKMTSADTATPTSVAINTPFVGTISDIGFGLSENEILITISNYGPSTVSVFYTTDGGVNWQNKEGDLPDMPVRAILMNPENTSEVIIGTEMGVWGTANFMSATPVWAQYAGDMGNVRVTDLDYRPSTKTILAATYGRGAWTNTNFTPLATSETDARFLSRVYPNPSRGPIHVKFDTSKFKKVNITIFDASGKLVYTKLNVASDEEFQANLPKGFYVIKADNGSEKVLSSSLIIK